MFGIIKKRLTFCLSLRWPSDKIYLYKGQQMKVSDLKQDTKNFRIHGDKNLKQIKKSIKRNGFGRSIVVDANNEIICGNGVGQSLPPDADLQVVETFGDKMVVIKRLDISGHDDKRRASLAVEDNATTDSSTFDFELLQETFTDIELEDMGIDIESPPEDEGKKEEAARAKLADTFLIPPMSILDTRRGEWQDRKRAWNALIKDEGESRQGTLGFSSLITESYGKTGIKNVSILDATLAELVNKWFLPTGQGACKTFDPFAGDTVFGFVSAYLGNEFTGVELRAEQAELNNARTADISARYICDDGQNIGNHLDIASQDLMFSCPPYFDLEKYSDNPLDASNQKEYEDFRKILENALTAGVNCLKDNRFAVIVMSNVRSPSGGYYDMCSDITRIMQAAGCSLYNEFILVNSVGTGAIRARKNMEYRKNTRCHQEVLVFYKGSNQKQIKNEFGQITFAEMETTADEGADDASADVE